MRQIQISSPAKINLFLRILDRRLDGYHNIETVFEKVSLFDRLIIKENPANKIIIESNIKDSLFLNKNNTIYKAILLIKRKFRINRGVYVNIEKNIPIGAGLGGGSSDAAATLKALNSLWQLRLTKKELISLSGQIGSDVALFMLDGSFSMGRERGDKVSHISGTKNLKLWHILIVPDFSISTAFAYSLFDKYILTKKCQAKDCLLQGKLGLTIPSYGANIINYALSSRDVSLLNYYSYNSFESVILRQFPKLDRFKKILEQLAKDFVHMSGSGSTLFMTFSNRKEAQYLLKKVNKVTNKCRTFLVDTY